MRSLTKARGSLPSGVPMYVFDRSKVYQFAGFTAYVLEQVVA
jgi:hypothetical protein